MNKYYLYRHIRLDKNEPFYIGIGTVYQVDINSSLETVYYKRAYCKQRSGIWYNVTNKTNYTKKTETTSAKHFCSS